MNAIGSDPDIKTLDVYYALAGVVGRRLETMVCVFTYRDSGGHWVQSAHMLGEDHLKMIEEAK